VPFLTRNTLVFVIVPKLEPEIDNDYFLTGEEDLIDN